MITLEARQDTGIMHGPLNEEVMFTSNVDFYKPTMSQLAFEKERDAEVTFTFHNRGEQRLLDYIDPVKLQARFDALQAQGIHEDEIGYLATMTNKQGEPLFSDEYLNYLATTPLPEVKVTVTDDINIETTGAWPIVTYWETVVMSEVNEAYFASYVTDNGLDIFDVYDEGDRRLTEKIELLKQNPDIKIIDFGARRHFSLRWHRHVLERLKTECPDNITGASGTYLAKEAGLAPSGTFAHETYMIYCGLADGRGEDIRKAHAKLLDDWYDLYGFEKSIALTDTYGNDFFFEDFGAERAHKWYATKHDSGDPFEYGEKVIRYYQELGIDPATKAIVFSDGLDIETIFRLHQQLSKRINVMFGWGTNLTNDLGIEPLSIVMKATEVNGTKTVKLSDNPEKHTGPLALIKRYKKIFAIAVRGR